MPFHVLYQSLNFNLQSLCRSHVKHMHSDRAALNKLDITQIYTQQYITQNLPCQQQVCVGQIKSKDICTQSKANKMPSQLLQSSVAFSRLLYLPLKKLILQLFVKRASSDISLGTMFANQWGRFYKYNLMWISTSVQFRSQSIQPTV